MCGEAAVWRQHFAQNELPSMKLCVETICMLEWIESIRDQEKYQTKENKIYRINVESIQFVTVALFQETISIVFNRLEDSIRRQA